MTGLEVDDISVRYGSAIALDHFSLQAATGEIVAVVGPSGSGKSTLLRAVAGLEPLVNGRILLEGRDLHGVPTHRRGLGLMFQDHGLFTHLSVADNIAYGLRTAGVAKSIQQSRVTELLKLVGLDDFGSRSTSQLSGGEAQRVALARALAPEPGLLMLDEPLGSLDRGLRDQLTGDLRRLLTELGQTALHVTHDQAEAFALADRVVIVGDGRPVAVGTPSQLWADPGSRFVAEFLGHPNIWTVTVGPGRSVNWAGLNLGELNDDHDLATGAMGERLVVMPTSAIQLIPDISVGRSPETPQRPSRHEVVTVKAAVTEVIFRHGIHDVTATTLAGSELGYPIRFTTAETVRPEQSIAVQIDVSALRPLEQ